MKLLGSETASFSQSLFEGFVTLRAKSTKSERTSERLSSVHLSLSLLTITVQHLKVFGCLANQEILGIVTRTLVVTMSTFKKSCGQACEFLVMS